ncbi:MAG: ligase-associated DNA damage response endonuclease PdeM [Bacteroidota bacterium]
MTQFVFREQTFHLHPYKAIFWQEQSALLIADVHLGKVAHFRKSGIAVPRAAGQENWDKLLSLLMEYQPKKVWFLGDLFHSEYNDVWEELTTLIQQFSAVEFTLIKGNHDILSVEQYEAANLKVVDEIKQSRLLLTHHPLEEIPDGYYNLAGHLHPGVVLRGSGRQRMRLPCFYFGAQQAILPAFGSFTGMMTMQPKRGDQVFIVSDEQVVEVS